MSLIRFEAEKKVFVLETEHSMYQMQVGKFGVLLHLYYGRKIGDSLVTERIIKRDRGFSGNPYEAEGDRTFSLDVLPQEYPGFGNGGYRISALEAEHEDGSSIADFRYVSHKIYPGKYQLPGLPAAHAKETEAETLEITVRDQGADMTAVLYYSAIPGCDVIARAVRIVNNGEKEITIKRVMSAAVDFENRPMDMIQFHGRHGMERLLERHPIHHGIQSIGSLRGTSSHHYNPFLILCDHGAGEGYGECYGMSFLYSGNFLAEVETDQMNQVRAVMGIHPGHFAYRLHKGESFTAPEVLLSYSGAGLEQLSHNYHKAYRSHVCRGRYVKERRPVLVNNWEATYFDFDAEKLYHIAKTAKETGIEMLVMDDGWFGKRDSDTSSLGDWWVNTDKLKGGLPALVEKINGLGLKFGIWVEPEMISEDSQLYRQHPDWCMQIPGRLPNRSRSQFNLDITRKEVRDFIMECLFAVFDSCNIEYVKWDMNRSLSNVYSAALPPERQGEVYHRYVLGLYEMQERLMQRYPNLLLENCSGGGGRFDGGMLYYSPQIWCSDNTDAIERLKIQYGTSFGYPVSAAGSHVSACPSHQTGRSTPFETRGTVAMAGTFGYELDLEKLTREEMELVRKQIREYQELAPLILSGDYYRLSSPYGASRYTVWELVAEDKSEAAVMGVQIRPECNPVIEYIRFRGLEPEAHYRMGEQVYTGAALMYAGVPLPDLTGDYQSFRYQIKKITASEGFRGDISLKKS